MEIQKIFSDYYDEERLYSVLLTEDEMNLYQHIFANVNGEGIPNMVWDDAKGKMVRNPKLFKNGQTAEEMKKAVEEKSATAARREAKKAAYREEKKAAGKWIKKARLAEKRALAEGVESGRGSATIKDAIKNTWKNSGKAGKAGMIAAGLAVPGALAGAAYAGRRSAKNND